MLDSFPSDASLEGVVAAAAGVAGCPLALLLLPGEGRHWAKSLPGPLAAALPRVVDLCERIAHATAVRLLPDTRLDAVASAHETVRCAPHLRACAAFPVRVNGTWVGALCVLDVRVRQFDDEQRRTLEQLALAAAELLTLRLRLRDGEHERQRLYDFARASGDWMWETDAEHRYTWISDAYEAATGSPTSRWIGERIVDAALLDEHGQPSTDGATLHALLARRQRFARAVTEQQVDGRTLYVSRSAVPVLDAAGVFQGWRGTSRDLSARIRQGAIVREQERRLAKLMAQLPGVLFQYRRDPDGRGSYPYASERVRELFGVEPPGEGVAVDPGVPYRMLHPDDRAGFVQSIDDSAHRLHRWVREFRIVRADGEVRWMETRATPERLPDGATVWHGFTTDVTERKQIELALRRTEQQWELAAEATGIGMASVDMETHAVSFDRRTCRIHGFDHPHPPMSLADWLAPIDDDERGPVQTALHEAMARRTTLETRYRISRADGSRRLLEIVARGIYGAQGQPLGLVGTCRDVTEQAEGERLRREKESAERANRAKTEFLSRVSHELRTPLNGILGFAQLMALDSEHPLAPAQRQRLASVQQAGGHLLGLINDVLDLSRAEHPELALQRKPVDAARALRNALLMIQPLARSNAVALPASPAAAHWVSADARGLEQVLMNLLSNATKYNRRGGRVDIAIATRSGRVRIDVADQGAGLTREQQAGLFQPFNRLGAEQRRIEGSGLGLVIARELVRAMGGELHVASTPGCGSTFSVLLDAAVEPVDGSGPAAAPSPQPPLPAAELRRLLYIEDEPLNVVLMEEVVRTRAQWHMDVARDGASGLQLARELRPDLLLIDMNLPDMNGLELIRTLRGDPQTADLRCIALSADAMSEQIEAARNAGFDDYWTKPIDVVRMLGTLSVVLASQGPE